MYHLGNPDYVIITTAYKANESLPGILLQYTNARKLGCLRLEVRVC